MSRTTLCWLTAGGLAILSLAVMGFRLHVLGDEIRAPVGPGAWKITLMVRGKAEGDARLTTAAPLSAGHQFVIRESCRSSQFQYRPPDLRLADRHPERRVFRWALKPGTTGEFRAVYECYCALDAGRPTTEMLRRADAVNAAPRAGQYLELEAAAPADSDRLAHAAREQTVGCEGALDQAAALYRFVDQQIANEPNVGREQGTSAAECLRQEGGDARAKSRLLVALLRHRGVPARVVTGLKLVRGEGHVAHYWAEAWSGEHWLALCPFHHHYGRVPSTYVVFGYGDQPIVRAWHVKDLHYALLVEKAGVEEALGATASPLKRALRALSLYMLPPGEQQLVEFLLLLPVAALIICIYRNLIGLSSFGMFAPALVGLAFRDLHSLPGIFVFVSILLIGWLLRRLLDHYHLLQVPRVAFMLSLVVVLLIAAIVLANSQDLAATRYVSLFPMVILTGMIERFWTLETEDGTASSFKTLLCTLLIAGTISLVVSIRPLVDLLFRHPELIGLFMACQLLLGRYTGYRLSELFRFRDFVQTKPTLQLYPSEPEA